MKYLIPFLILIIIFLLFLTHKLYKIESKINSIYVNQDEKFMFLMEMKKELINHGIMSKIAPDDEYKILTHYYNSYIKDKRSTNEIYEYYKKFKRQK